ncbi:MAG: NAD(P)-dependent oxidoreductase [Propioniciclava sp.]
MVSHGREVLPRSDSSVVIGLGAMGLPMAVRLLAGGPVRGVERSPERAAAARAVGVEPSPDLAAVAGASLVLVMVARPADLEGVVEAALPHVAGGQTWVLSGTYGVEATVSVADLLAGAGAAVIDAPVTGGVAGAQSGRLLLFCAGDETVLAGVQDRLALVGEPHLVGAAPGDGQRLKAINQLLCTIHLAAAGEALNLARAVGLDVDAAARVLGAGAASSWMFTDRAPLMLHGTPEVRSAIEVFVKDAGIAAGLACQVGAPAPVLDAARQQFLAAADAGLAREDDSTIYRLYGRQTPPSRGNTNHATDEDPERLS